MEKWFSTFQLRGSSCKPTNQESSGPCWFEPVWVKPVQKSKGGASPNKHNGFNTSLPQTNSDFEPTSLKHHRCTNSCLNQTTTYQQTLTNTISDDRGVADSRQPEPIVSCDSESMVRRQHTSEINTASYKVHLSKHMLSEDSDIEGKQQPEQIGSCESESIVRRRHT